MNRFGIVITRTYWITLGLSTLSVFALSVLKILFPSPLWMIATAVIIVILGRIAAKSCTAHGKEFHIGRSFLWSYISLVIGKMTAHIICSTEKWTDSPVSDYSVYYYTDSDIFYSHINSVIARFMEFLQTPKTFLLVDFIQIVYISVFIALITGAFIKIK